MEAQRPSGSSSSSTAYPRWVMLEQYMEIKVEDSSFSPTDDCKTLASARTSAGHQIQVSLRLVEPPALSRVFLRIPNGVKEEKSKVLAAHGDSVLIQVCIQEKDQRYTAEHFVYNAGAPAAEPPRPPSLLLLPPYYVERYTCLSELEMVPRQLGANSTGLLRRGEDELIVAQLTALSFLGVTSRLVDLKLYLFRSDEWNCYDIEIREDWNLPLVMWDTVIPIGGRQLCWVDLCHGVMLLDVFEVTPNVRYRRLPMDFCECSNRSNRNVCATAGGGMLKFVCCGAAATCGSRHDYTIHTWTMRIDGGDMEWMKDGMVDATELWALNAYKGLPCYPLDRPVVSLDEPEVICFRLCGNKWVSQTIWQIMVNMRSKRILSVSRHKNEVGYGYTRDKLIPSNVSNFFNTSTGEIQIAEKQLIISDNNASNPTLQPSSVAEPASAMASVLMRLKRIELLLAATMTMAAGWHLFQGYRKI